MDDRIPATTPPHLEIRLRPLLVAAIIAVTAAACDPAAPGASGVIELGPDADPTAFQTLALRAFADSSGSFDPTQPTPPGAYFINEPLAALTFPHPYVIGGGIGESDVSGWLFVAWLSHRPRDNVNDDVSGLDPGDIFCAVPFQVAGIWGTDQYGAVTPNIYCTLADSVPAAR